MPSDLVAFAVTPFPDGAWKKVPNSENYCKAVKIEYGTNIILHQDQDVQFMCIFYGMDDRESLGFPIGMLLKDL